MNGQIISLFVLTLLVVVIFATQSDRRQTILRIHRLLNEQVADSTQDFRFLPFQFATQKGLYRSFIHLNLMDESNSEQDALFRKLFQIEDMNMFVTNFVLLAQFDTSDLGLIDIDRDLLLQSVSAIATYKDKDLPEGVPVYRFWPQKKNGSYWESYPVNLQEPLNYVPSLGHFLELVLRTVGLGDLWHRIEPAIGFIETALVAFHIPSDADDSSCNLALGAALRKHKDKYPEANNIWEKTNVYYKEYFAKLKKYAYKPFAVNATDYTDMIDTRSYYYMHDFLEQIQANARKQNKEPTLLLPATWLANVNEDRVKSPIVSMPFHSNNVDLSVATNTLYGINQFILSRSLEESSAIFDTDLQQMYSDIVDFLVYGIQSEIILRRPDISLLYYPSLFDFYWFVARNVYLLEEHSGKLPYPIMQKALDTLKGLVRNEVTQQLFSMAQYDSQNNYIFWDDFLGDYANVSRGEDRLFSTAVALNALLDSWTVSGTTCKRVWENAPNKVKLEAERAGNYLAERIFDDSLLNAFFSGSVKDPGVCLPFFYPSTYNQYLNGTNADPHNEKDVNTDLIIGVRGVLSREKYAAMLKDTWAGKPVPEKFKGYNPAIFPFWSSPAMTYSMTMLALGKLTVLEECG